MKTNKTNQVYLKIKKRNKARVNSISIRIKKKNLNYLIIIKYKTKVILIWNRFKSATLKNKLYLKVK